MDKQTKRRIEIEACKVAMRKIIAILPQMPFTDESMNEYIETYQDDDKNNELILAVRKAIELTEAELL